MGRIVVGVDGSESSLRALRWAIVEARRRGDDVDAISAWVYPIAAVAPGVTVPLAPTADQGADAMEHLMAAIQLVSQEAEGVTINPIVTEGDPAQVLIEASKGADLLVVGSHGRGGFLGLLLGSVAQKVSHHATCPVVVIPDPDRR